MTAGRLSPEDREYLRKSCEESGVPVKITDPTVVQLAADILNPPLPRDRNGRPERHDRV